MFKDGGGKLVYDDAAIEDLMNRDKDDGDLCYRDALPHIISQ